MQKNKLTNNFQTQNYKSKKINLNEWFLLLIINLFLFLQWKIDFLIIPIWLKVLLISSLIIFPVGFILTKIFFKEIENFFEKIVISFNLGYTFFSIICFIAYLLSLKLFVFISVFLITVVFISFICILFYRYEYVKKFPSNEKSFRILLILFLILSIYLSIHYGAWISGDAIIHLPKIRQIVELNRIEYNSFFVKGLKVEQRGHNPVHPLLAVISVISNLDCFYIWIYIIVLLSPIKLLTFYISSKEISNNDKFAVFSTSVLFILEGILNRSMLSKETFFPFWIFGSAMPCVGAIVLGIFYPFILFLIFRFLKKQDKKILISLSLVCLSTAFTHMMYYLYILFAVTGFFIFSLIFRRYYNSAYKLLFLVVIFVCLPSFIYTTYMTKKINHPIINPAFKSMTGEVSPGYNPIKFIDKDKRFPIVNPFEGLFFSPFSAISFLFFIFAIKELKNNLFCLLMIAILCFVLLVIFNPLILYFLKPMHPPLSAFYMIVVVIPYLWMFSYFMYELIKLLRKFNSLIYYLVIFVFCIYLSFSILNNVEKLANIRFTSRDSIKMLNQYKEIKKFIDLKIPYGSVVIMEKNFIWYWPVFFSHFPMTHPNRGLLPPNYDVEFVDKQIGNLLSNPDNEESIKFVKKYNVNYILLTKDLNIKNYEKILDIGNLKFYKPIF